MIIFIIEKWISNNIPTFEVMIFFLFLSFHFQLPETLASIFFSFHKRGWQFSTRWIRIWNLWCRSIEVVDRISNRIRKWKISISICEMWWNQNENRKRKVEKINWGKRKYETHMKYFFFLFFIFFLKSHFMTMIIIKKRKKTFQTRESERWERILKHKRLQSR